MCHVLENFLIARSNALLLENSNERAESLFIAVVFVSQTGVPLTSV